MAMIEKEIYVIRHGQTAYNAQGIVQGKGIDAPLNELGVKQSNAFYEVYKHVRFDVVYTSTLLRAQQTAKRFLDIGIPHIITADLDEISWGDAEGSGNFTDHSEMFNNLLKEWKNGNTHYALPGGESPNDVQQRQLRFIAELKQSSVKTVLIATHGRYIRSLMCTISNLPLSQMDTFEHANLCLYKVNLLSNGKFEIEQHNNQHHLEELTNF